MVAKIEEEEEDGWFDPIPNDDDEDPIFKKEVKKYVRTRRLHDTL